MHLLLLKQPSVHLKKYICESKVAENCGLVVQKTKYQRGACAGFQVKKKGSETFLL